MDILVASPAAVKNDLCAVGQGWTELFQVGQAHGKFPELG